jgi:hypothetical protein
MGILVDTLDDEFASLNPGVESDPKPAGQEPIVSTKELNEFTIPEKFKGKTAEEIAQSYVELERHQGSLNNQLGDYRSMTDRFLSIEEKRVADLETTEQEEFEIDPTELLANPGKVLDEYYEHRSAQDPNQATLLARLDQLEGQVGQSALANKHDDATKVLSTPEFQAWVGEDSFRGRIAQQAVASKDVEALDYLLTQFKGTSSTAQADTANESGQQSEVSRAQSVATESSSSGNASASSEKRFSRRKLVHLKMTNPDEYSARSDEILLAYAQKRVDD